MIRVGPRIQGVLVGGVTHDTLRYVHDVILFITDPLNSIPVQFNLVIWENRLIRLQS